VTRYRLATEIFSLPNDRGRLIYAPLLQTSLVVNDAALNLLADVAAERRVTRDGRTGPVLDLLEELSLIKEADEAPAKSDADHLPGAGTSGADPACLSAPVRPTDVTLFLTTACNLRCVYCYASGGDHPRYLDQSVAFDAIDLVVTNAVEAKVTKVRLSFHGGGEPTLAAEALAACVAHARRRCDAAGVELATGTATNGVMSDRTRDVLADTMTSVMVSMDGPPQIQDCLRPRTGGGPSSADVERTLERLSRSGVTLGVRVTCAPDALDHAVETTRRLAGRYRLGTIHLEPLFVCGRSIHNGLRPPEAERFVEVFRACREEAASHGVDVTYSGARRSLSCSFCQASKPSFNVTTEGDVTACYEVTGRDDARAGTFFYGRHERERRSFVFDAERVASLRRLTVASAPRCARCFAKYHCAGDCPAKRLFPGADEAVAARCEINRRLTLEQLERALLSQAAATG
jgi:uncharacterized protein